MPSIALGVALLLTGLVLNEWTVSRILGIEGSLHPDILRYTVWLIQLTAIAAGMVLLRVHGRIQRVWMLVVPVIVLTILGAAEVLTRIALARSRSPLRAISIERGWETVPGVDMDYVHPAFGRISFSTGRHGFRRFDDPGVSRLRILVLGDSYTEATQVSDGEAYFDQLNAFDPGLSIFAYGTGGYGTLQEYMVLDKHFDSIDPGMILWQLSANDLVNNDHFLEVRSPLSSRMTRPYLEEGEVVRRFSASGMAARYSRLVRFVDARVAMMRGHGFKAVDLGRERELYPEALARSIRTTGEIMRMARSRSGAVPILGFAAEGDAFADSVFRELASSAGWDYLPGVPDSIEHARKAGAIVDGLPRDGHWNSTGHAIAGRVIARYLSVTWPLSGKSSTPPLTTQGSSR